MEKMQTKSNELHNKSQENQRMPIAIPKTTIRKIEEQLCVGSIGSNFDTQRRTSKEGCERFARPAALLAPG